MNEISPNTAYPLYRFQTIRALKAMHVDVTYIPSSSICVKGVNYIVEI